MSNNVLYKDKFNESANPASGSWSFLNHHDHSTISKDFYALVVPNQVHPTLDTFSLLEEKEFWHLTFDVAKIALEQLNAGSKKTREVLLGVNDGVWAGQTVPHTHSHIVGLHEDNNIQRKIFNGAACDLKSEMEVIRENFCPDLNEPSGSAIVQCDLADLKTFTDNIRAARKVLSAEAYRIYASCSLGPQTDRVKMVVEACDQENPQFSVAKGMRVINKLMEPEGLKGTFGLGRFVRFAQGSEPIPAL